MQKLLVCDKWEMPLIDGTTGFYHWLNQDRHIKELGRHAECFEWVTQEIPKHLSWIEHYGGVGMCSTIIQKAHEPSSHIVYEIEEDCINQLKYLLGSNGKALFGNSKDTMGEAYSDVVFLDWPNTARHYEDYKTQWAKVVALQPKYIVWTDAAGKFLHTPSNKNAYGKFFECAINSKEDYVEAFSDLMYQRTGYGIYKCGYQHAYAIFLSKLGNPEAIEYKKFSDGSKGLSRV